MTKIRLILLFLFAYSVACAQNYNQNPFRVRWKKIDTEHFEVVFSDEIISEGQRLANTLEHIYFADSKTLDAPPKPISIILFNKTTESNGAFMLAPRYSKFHTTPMQDATRLGSSDWLQLLAVHEFRHVVQHQKSSRYFTRFASIFYGQYAHAGLSWSEPLWFAEGDAVSLETALTNGGRGRIPAFDMHIRSLLMNDCIYSYDKAYLGSYKDYFPNYYSSGYLLTVYARRNYGDSIFGKVLDRTSKFSFWPYAFSNSLKKFTGYNNPGIYKQAMHDLDSLWRRQIKGLQFANIRKINRQEKKIYTSYLDPQFTTNENIIARKNGLDTPSMLVVFDSLGKEKIIRQIEIDNFISTGGDKVAWNQQIPAVRWGNRSFSDVYVYNLTTDKLKKITRRAKLFAPALSPDGSKIIAVEYTSEMNSSLVLINVNTGKEIRRFESPGNDFIRTPSWSADGKKVVFTHSSTKGQALSVLTVETGIFSTIIPYNPENISKPVMYGNYILYNSPYSGTGNIYTINTITRQRYRVVSRKYGAYNVSVNIKGDSLIFQDYDIKGYNIAKIPFDTASWKKIENVEDRSLNYYRPIVEQEQNGFFLHDDSIDYKSYEVKKYSRLRNFFYFHSWGFYPFALDEGDLSLPPEVKFMLFSNNKLNTSYIEAGTKYDFNENEFTHYIDLSYMAFFPVFSINANTGKRKTTIAYKNNYYTINWRENSAQLNVTLPFDFSRSIYQHNLYLSASIQHLHFDYDSEKFLQQLTELFVPYSVSLQWSLYQNGSERDFLPKWGAYLKLSCREILPESDWEGELLHALTNVYIPGFAKHHSIRLQNGYEKQLPADENINTYQFSSQMVFARGYESVFYPEKLKFSVDYSFPLFYPDFSIGSLIYIKRVRTNLFYDHTIGTVDGSSDIYQSAGMKLSFDFDPLQMPYDFNFGLRISHRFTDNKLFVEPVLISLTL